MIRVFTLPDLGEGLTESEIVAWKVSVGDAVALNQVIAEVETAKAVVELPSPYDGVISQLHEQPGTVVEVGKPIVSFEVLDAEFADSAQAAAGAPAGEPQRVPTLVGYGAEPETGGRPARRARLNQVPADSPESGGAAAPAAAAPAPVTPD
ncbi:MAG: 2-oxo acid dehydrogenase subunit E2, partial [Renibacterium salmoninarum]|nr:2-oxo acid dehydrogenase subunit E2 [Renibacterium salmoninarum]